MVPHMVNIPSVVTQVMLLLYSISIVLRPCKCFLFPLMLVLLLVSAADMCAFSLPAAAIPGKLVTQYGGLAPTAFTAIPCLGWWLGCLHDTG
jgi:hypothetical protein